MKLIVQIPAYNEETTIGQTLRDLPKKIDGITSIETLVIDDGSTDKTADAARHAGVTHVVQLRSHRGLSAAFSAGIHAALRLGADIIVNTDADNQYAGSDVAKLVAPIVRGTAEVVIGDRQVAKSPYMSAFKRTLQRLGSWTVGKASGVDVADVTSGFRAFSREAALQLNVFNPFTYTLETIIQAGNRNLAVQTVPVKTNAPTRPSRLYRGIGSYLRKSAATIFRVSTIYRPLKTFFTIGAILILAGVAIGGRFLWLFANGDRGGHVQSLILSAVFLIIGFQTMLIGLLADLIAVNRRIGEETLIRLRRLEQTEAADRKPQPRQQPQRQQQQQQQPPPRRERPQRPAATPAAAQPVAPATQWVWLLDEEKLQTRGMKASEKPEPEEIDDDELEAPSAEEAKSPRPAGTRRRRRRGRGGVRQHTELPGNRGKHLAGDDSSSE